MSRPLLVDLFCGAGGASKGYADAGFEVVGVDHRRQPRYPFEFVQGDALAVLAELLGTRPVAVLAGSPPCQGNSSLRHLSPGVEYVDLIPDTRAAFVATGLPYVIENVVGARLRSPHKLCGSSFGLGVRRHRLFEVNWPLWVPPCAHGQQVPRYPVGLGSPSRRAGDLSPVAYVYGSTRYPGDLADRKAAMGIDWMTNAELTQAIPPAYTQWIGMQLLAYVRAEAIA